MPCAEKAEAAQASNEAVRQAERERDLAEEEMSDAEVLADENCRTLGNPISCAIARVLHSQAVKKFELSLEKYDKSMDDSDRANYKYDQCLRKCLYMTPI